MAEYIDRKEFIRIQCSVCDGNCESFDKCVDCDADCRCDFIKDLADIPAADVVPKARVLTASDVMLAHERAWNEIAADLNACRISSADAKYERIGVELLEKELMALLAESEVRA